MNMYARAYTEVLEIIKYFPKEEYSKIPKETIEYYKNNMDKNYRFTINPEIDLSEQNISKEANAVIIKLYMDYFATENQKVKIQNILELNQEKAEQERREKYNPDDLFKNKNKTEKIEKNLSENALIEYKENFFIKFKNVVFKLLHLKH